MKGAKNKRFQESIPQYKRVRIVSTDHNGVERCREWFPITMEKELADYACLQEDFLSPIGWSFRLQYDEQPFDPESFKSKINK